MSIKLTDLEIKVLKQCNDKVNIYGLSAQKIKIKRTYHYYLMLGDKQIIGNNDLVQFKSFCDNDEDVKSLAQIAELM